MKKTLGNSPWKGKLTFPTDTARAMLLITLTASHTLGVHVRRGGTAAQTALEGAHIDARGYLNQKQSMKVLYNHPTGTAGIRAKALCYHWKKNLHQCCLHNCWCCKPACSCVSPAPGKEQVLVRGPHLPKENSDSVCAESCQVHTSQTPETVDFPVSEISQSKSHKQTLSNPSCQSCKSKIYTLKWRGYLINPDLLFTPFESF